MNKLIYADMSINMAISLLKNIYNIERVNVLSLEFGLSNLKTSITKIDFVSGDEVFLTNLPYAVGLIKEDVVDEVDGFNHFINSFYILNCQGELILAKSLTNKELRPAHSFDRLITNGAFNFHDVNKVPILKDGSKVRVKAEDIALGVTSQIYTVVGDFFLDSPDRVVCFKDVKGFKRALRYSDLIVVE